MTIVPVMDLREEVELSTADRAELGRYEALIRRGLDTFVEVGNALAAIRDNKLYRGTHATFLDYCRERWDLGRSHVYRLMDAATVVGNLSESSPMGEVGERVLRPLTKLEPEQQREAWQEAVEASNGKVTAAHVEKAVAKFAPPKSPQPKPDPVQYAPVYALESKVSEWLRDVTGEAGTPNAETVLANVKLQLDEPHSPGNWLDMLETYVGNALTYRKKDLHQAINNVREQRRVAQRQAQARKVYVEPAPKAPTTEASNPFAPRMTKVEEIDGVTVHHMEFAATLPTPQPASDGILTREWIAHVLERYNPANADFDAALKAATLPELQDAMATLWPEEPHHRERCAKLKARMEEFAPAPVGPIYTHEAIMQRLYRVAQDLEPGAGLIMFEDYLEGREGWYHDLLIGYKPLECSEDLFRQAVSGALAEVRHQSLTTPTTPDPRLEDARALVELLVAARDTARAHYGELIGQHTDMLEFERGVAAMLPPLERLIAVLEGVA